MSVRNDLDSLQCDIEVICSTVRDFTEEVPTTSGEREDAASAALGNYYSEIRALLRELADQVDSMRAAILLALHDAN